MREVAVVILGLALRDLAVWVVVAMAYPGALEAWEPTSLEEEGEAERPEAAPAALES